MHLKANELIKNFLKFFWMVCYNGSLGSRLMFYFNKLFNSYCTIKLPRKLFQIALILAPPLHGFLFHWPRMGKTHRCYSISPPRVMGCHQKNFTMARVILFSKGRGGQVCPNSRLDEMNSRHVHLLCENVTHCLQTNPPSNKYSLCPSCNFCACKKESDLKCGWAEP